MAGYFHHYLGSASDILEAYRGVEPFSLYLKSYFKKNKKFGSRDRKFISDLCYGYLRIGKAADTYDIDVQIKIGYYLTHQVDFGFIETFAPELKETISEPLEQKLNLISILFPGFNASDIFSFSDFVSSRIEKHAFSISHLQKPTYFIKIRPGRKEQVIQKLDQHSIPYQEFGELTIGIEQNIDLASIFIIEEEIVVQDISSQNTIEILKGIKLKGDSVWDACAGGGGKSILIADKFRFKSNYTSDIRPSILESLEKRLKKANINLSGSFCTDLSNPLSIQAAKQFLPKEGIELIIADVPCTGSGTWGRSPEWLRVFDASEIDVYQQRQINIVENLLSFLRKDGYLLYITCSVFEKENEQVVNTLIGKHHLKIINESYLLGYPQKGDQLYAALITL